VVHDSLVEGVSLVVESSGVCKTMASKLLLPLYSLIHNLCWFVLSKLN